MTGARAHGCPKGAAPDAAHAHGAAASAPALTGMAKTVFDNYIKLQTTLAQDSLKAVKASAEALAQAVKTDSTNAFPAPVAEQAKALAKANDLSAARAAFKTLSQSLIQYRAANKDVAAAYAEAFCPMAQAGWLQVGNTINNPYMGQAMLRCGQIKK